MVIFSVNHISYLAHHRVNKNTRREPVIEKAAKASGLSYKELNLPVELTVWIDPEEVCCRFGENKGSYCVVASFKGDDKENRVDNFDFSEMEIEKKFDTDKVRSDLAKVFVLFVS